jgi:signal transduction histidine kinase
MFSTMEAHVPAETPAHRLVDHLVESSGRWSTVVVATGLVAGLGVSYAVMYALGGARAFAATFFILLVMVAAVRFRYTGAVLTALAGGALAGPLMPFDVRAGTPQLPPMWISRGVTLLLVGVVSTAFVERIRAGHGRELALTQKERDLAIGKAAVVTTVAHEFRSPLTVINGVARMLNNEQAIPEQFAPLFRGLMDSTDRLIDLVATMGAVLDGGGGAVFLRTETLVTREVLGAVMARIAIRDANGRVRIEIAPDAEFVQTDRELLEQLLRHVVENALKFSGVDQPVEVRVSRKGQHLGFDVSDRGSGIDPNLLAGDPFTQGDQSITREHAGLGLGLFAAARMAEMLGGSLTFDGRRGGGSVVRILVASSAPPPGAS